MELGIPELLIILVIVIVLFGPGRIGKTMGELGKGLRSFRDAMSTNKDDDDEPKSSADGDGK
jgi:sec-independent protein translocase protein TatA